MYKLVRLIIALASAANIVGCSQYQSCQELKNTVSDEAIEQKLVSWVDSFSALDVSTKRLSFDGSMLPGELRVLQEFSWDSIDFKVDGQIRLISPIVNGGLDYDNAFSVFFGERTGFGYLVKFEGSPSYGLVDMSDVYQISERVSVMCSPSNV